MNIEQSEEWRVQCLSFLVTRNAFSMLASESNDFAERSNEFSKKWFHWSINTLVGDWKLKRFDVLDQLSPEQAVNWVLACQQHGITPVVVVNPGEVLGNIDHLPSARVAYVDRAPDGSWMDQGWLLRRLATPDAFVLNHWHGLRHGFDRAWDMERFSSVKGFWPAYSVAFAKWYEENNASTNSCVDRCAWDPVWGEWSEPLILSEKDVKWSVVDGAVRVVVPQAPYLHFILSLASLHAAANSASPLSLGDDGWATLSAELVTTIVDSEVTDPAAWSAAEDPTRVFLSRLTASRKQTLDAITRQQDIALAAGESVKVRLRLFTTQRNEHLPAGAEIGEVLLDDVGAWFSLVLPKSLMSSQVLVEIAALGLRSKPVNMTSLFDDSCFVELKATRGTFVEDLSSDLAVPVILTIGTLIVPCWWEQF